MKNRLYSIAIYAVFLIPFVAPWEGGRQTPGDQATKGVRFQEAKNASFFMPGLDIELSDLDARDAQNRPIKTPEAPQVLAELFINRLFQLTVLNDPHSMELIWTDLTLYSHLFRDLIFNVFHPLWVVIPIAIQPTLKRFVHNVHNLWVTVVVGLSLCSALALKFSVNSSPQRLILRC